MWPTVRLFSVERCLLARQRVPGFTLKTSKAQKWPRVAVSGAPERMVGCVMVTTAYIRLPSGHIGWASLSSGLWMLGGEHVTCFGQ